MVVLMGSDTLAGRLATVLGAGHRVVRVPVPDGADAGVRLAAAREAGERHPELALVAAGEDERNLLTAAAARRAGARLAAAVVRAAELAASADLASALGIDRLIDPEAELAAAVWAAVSGPVAAAVQAMGRGRVRVSEVVVPQRSRADGRTLRDLSLPAGSRIALIRRGEGRRVEIAPSASSVVHAGDRVLLVANRAVAAGAAAALGAARDPSGGSVVAVLREGRGSACAPACAMAQRLLDLGAPARVMRASEVRAAGERVEAVVALDTSAGGRGARVAAAKVVHLARGRAAGREAGTGAVRIDAAEAVARAVDAMLPAEPVRSLGPAAAGQLEVYRVQAGRRGEWLGAPLREVPALRGWTVLAIQAGREAHLPHPDDVIQPGEVLVVLGPPGKSAVLRRGLRGV